MNLNKAFIGGNLTRDPELKYIPNGTAVAHFGVAINRNWKDDQGETKEEVTFLNVEAWGRTAEVISQYLKKGSQIFIEGRLKLEQWDDKQSGQKRSAIKVVCERFQFVGGNPGANGGDQPQRPTARGQAAAEAAQPDANYEEDIPF